MNKRILLVGNYPPPYGGVPTHIEYLSSFLKDKGWEVYILSFAGNKVWSKQWESNIEGVTIYRPSRIFKFLRLLSNPYIFYDSWQCKSFFVKDPRMFLACLNICHLIRYIVERNNIKVISAYHLTAGFAAAKISAQMGIPGILTVFGEIYDKPSRYLRLRSEVEAACRSSRMVTSCSKHGVNSLKQIGLDITAEHVYYGIDTSRFSPNQDGKAMREKLGISRDDYVFIYVGRMVEEMGLHILIEAIPIILEKRDNSKFLIIGAEGKLTPTALNLQRRYPEQVIVYPNVETNELSLLYAAADCCVTPSINMRALLGLAPAEAMASGRPAIVTDIGGGPEVVENGVTGILIKPGKVDALVAAAIKMIDNPFLGKEMGIKGRQRVLEFFDKDRTNEKMEKIFLELVET